MQQHTHDFHQQSPLHASSWDDDNKGAHPNNKHTHVSPLQLEQPVLLSSDVAPQLARQLPLQLYQAFHVNQCREHLRAHKRGNGAKQAKQASQTEQHLHCIRAIGWRPSTPVGSLVNEPSLRPPLMVLPQKPLCTCPAIAGGRSRVDHVIRRSLTKGSPDHLQLDGYHTRGQCRDGTKLRCGNAVADVLMRGVDW